MPGNETPQRPTLLDRVEALGNRLPDPAILFLCCTVLVMLASLVVSQLGWLVQPVRPELAEPGSRHIRLVETGEPIGASNLLSSKGLYWLAENLVRNFIQFPPLGVVLVSMLGVGVAERTGLIAAALRAAMRVVPATLLTPMVIFIGINASMAADAGFIILPPLAAALFVRAGRSPLAGIAAAFAGVAGGFSANLLVTSLDPLLSTLTQAGARIVDPEATVNPACNWWFMIASTLLITLVGWAVTSRIVEPRAGRRAPDDGGRPAPGLGVAAGEGEAGEGGSTGVATGREARALRGALAALALCAAVVLACVLVPGWPLYTARDAAGVTTEPARWITAIVPIIFVMFLVPALVYGRMSGVLSRLSDAARLMSESLASMAPMLVLAFFAAQFIACFRYSGLDRMLAFGVGKQLAAADLPPAMLLVALLLLVMMLNIIIASASAKWALLAPIFVPMFMLLGFSPALTQVAYRVGDSVTNTITPLNPYLVLVLLVVRQYAPRTRGRPGALLSLMTPYAVAFGAAWTVLLLVWFVAGWPLGPGGAVAR